MDTLAWISYPGGALVIPLEGPDDTQLICEIVECYGEVELTLNGVLARVRLANAYPADGCMQCGRRLDGLVCALRGRRLCMPCVRAIGGTEWCGMSA